MYLYLRCSVISVSLLQCDQILLYQPLQDICVFAAVSSLCLRCSVIGCCSSSWYTQMSHSTHEWVTNYTCMYMYIHTGYTGVCLLNKCITNSRKQMSQDTHEWVTNCTCMYMHIHTGYSDVCLMNTCVTNSRAQISHDTHEWVTNCTHIYLYTQRLHRCVRGEYMCHELLHTDESRHTWMRVRVQGLGFRVWGWGFRYFGSK